MRLKVDSIPMTDRDTGYRADPLVTQFPLRSLPQRISQQAVPAEPLPDETISLVVTEEEDIDVVTINVNEDCI